MAEIGDEELLCFVRWCKLNPAMSGQIETVRRVFDAYASLEPVGAEESDG